MNSKARRDVFGLSWNARTGVHEYGGTSAVVHDGVVYFSHFTDGRVYRVKDGQDPVAVTPSAYFLFFWYMLSRGVGIEIALT